MRLSTELNKLVDSGRSAGNDFLSMPRRALSGFKGAFTSGAAETAAGEVVAKRGILKRGAETAGDLAAMPFRAAGRTGGSVMKGSAKVGVWLVEQPLALGTRIVRGGVSAVGTVFKKLPILGITATVLGAAALASKGSRRRAEQRTQEQAAAEIEQATAIAQAQQGAAYAAPASGQPVSYQNSVTQAEYDEMNRRMADKAGHAAGVTAARQQQDAVGAAPGV